MYPLIADKDTFFFVRIKDNFLPRNNKNNSLVLKFAIYKKQRWGNTSPEIFICVVYHMFMVFEHFRIYNPRMYRFIIMFSTKLDFYLDFYFGLSFEVAVFLSACRPKITRFSVTFLVLISANFVIMKMQSLNF